MILQPLVENSVKHAIAPSSGTVTITLAAREEYGRLVLTVSDDGQGSGDDDEARAGYGIGLVNVRDRLAARFLRIHRSTILRRDRIRGLRHEGLGVWSVELDNGEALRIGRTYLRKVKAMAGR